MIKEFLCRSKISVSRIVIILSRQLTSDRGMQSRDYELFSLSSLAGECYVAMPRQSCDYYIPVQFDLRMVSPLKAVYRSVRELTW